MKRNRKHTGHVGGFDEFMKAFRSANRDIEYDRNGGRWIAKDRPHKNKKKYDRKRDRKIDFFGPNFYVQLTVGSQSFLLRKFIIPAM